MLVGIGEGLVSLGLLLSSKQAVVSAFYKLISPVNANFSFQMPLSHST